MVMISSGNMKNIGNPSRRRSSLDTEAVLVAYRRWAHVYDLLFGRISSFARKRAVEMVNALPNSKVLEVGVGTGLALPKYKADKQITGIDLSSAMLKKARKRTRSQFLTHVKDLLEMDAEAMNFPAECFDIAIAMFVASVVPNPRLLLSELKRVVKPDGHILFVNHFMASGGIRLTIEQKMAGLSRKLGWHPDFAIESLLPPEDLARAVILPAPPLGLFTLVHIIRQPKDSE